MSANANKIVPLDEEPVGSPKVHPPEDLCSSTDHDRSCFSLMGWAELSNVEKWLNMNDVYKLECTALGANISGSLTREMDVITKAGPKGEEIRHRFVRKIGIHDKGLGRCREAVFYLQFNPPENSTDKSILEKAKNSPLSQLRHYIPKCLFAHFDNTDAIKEKMAIVIERIDGVDSGFFFGRHSPLNWKFNVQSDIDKLLAPWTAHGITERHIGLATAKIAASIHGPFWNKVNDSLLHNEMFEHAARRELFLNVFDSTATGDEEPPSYFTEAINRAKNIWDAEKKRVEEHNKKYFESLAKQEEQENDKAGQSSTSAATTTDSSSSPIVEQPVKTPTTSPKISPRRSPPSSMTEDEQRPFGFSQLICDCLDASFAKTTWKNYLAQLREHPATLVHGDFHPANMIVERPKTEERDESQNPEDVVKLYLVDFEMFGFGSGPQELGQYMISHARPEQRKAHESEFVDAYIRHLQNDFNVATEESEINWIRKEYVLGGAGRWLWFLPILMSLGSDKNFRRYFHDQVYTFFVWHNITPETSPLIRI